MHAGRDTDQEDDVSVEVDAELDAVDDLLPGPAWDPEVGNQSHDGHGEKPAEDRSFFVFLVIMEPGESRT